jgi:hydroxyacylglutathione hydrolase
MADPTIVLTCGDNYIYVYPYDGRNAFVVDPSDASIVLRALERHDLTLTAVLITHHHWDHTAGVAELKSQTACDVIGPDERRIKGVDRAVADGDVLTLSSHELTALATPGHTRTSVCYVSTPAAPDEPRVVWTGDTLFVGGCGRPMECDASVLWRSLVKLTTLSDDMLVYCGHDYTAENYEFALSIDQSDRAVQQRLRDVRQAAKQGRPTVPSTMAQEKATNIFLRSDEPSIKAVLGMAQAQSAEVFAELRRRKNLFG